MGYEKLDRAIAENIYNNGGTIFLLPETLEMPYNTPSPITKANNGDFESAVTWYKGYKCSVRDRNTNICFYRQTD